MIKYSIFSMFVIAAFMVIPYARFGVPDAATTQGIIFIVLESVGKAIPALVIGCLGLLFKPNRFLGFVVCTALAVGLMFIGAQGRTQEDCHSFGKSVRLCSLPTTWTQVPKDTQVNHTAEAEFHGPNGFFAQIIRDRAGQNQGLTLHAGADAIVRAAQTHASAQNFKLLMRGTNRDIRDSEIIVYQANINGVPFIFADTLYVGRNENFQIVTWRVARELTAEDRAAHLEFGQGLVIMPDF